MKTYAQIKAANGEIQSLFRVQSDISYPQSTQPDGTIFIELSKEDLGSTTETDFKNSKYYRNNQWNTRPACPGPYYYWENFDWVKNLSVFWTEVRNMRDHKLLRCDWTQLADAQLNAEELTAWQTYRQALRDITTTYSSAETLEDITWPTSPS